MKKTIYLVTGAAGFLGSSVTKQLIERGDTVRALVLPNDKAMQYVPREAEIVAGMTIKGVFYAEKADAGMAIIEACKGFSPEDMEKTNEYMSFPMTFCFDSLNKKHRIILQGDIAHEVTLGEDIHGNITRLNNELEGMPKQLEYCRTQLAECAEQMAAAKQEITIPFEKADELQEKTARLAELNILLNMDDKTPDVMDDTPPEQGDESKRKKPQEYER